MKQPRNLKFVLIRISMIFAGVVFAMLLAEIVVRMSEQARLVKIFHYVNENEIEKGIAYGSKYLKPHPLLGFVKIPNTRRANKYGMIGYPYPIKKKEGVFRILSLGDSVTDWPQFAGYLEKYLKDKTSKRVEVWHNAVSGYGIMQYSKIVNIDIDKYKPDLVLLNLSLNDVLSFAYCKYYYENKKQIYCYSISEKKPFWFNDWLFQRSALYNEVFIRVMGVMNLSRREPAGIKFFELLKDLTEVTAARGVTTAAVLYPYMKTYNKDNAGSDMKMSEDIQVNCKKLKIPLLDLSPVFNNNIKGNSIETFRKNADDFIHFKWDSVRNFVFPAIGDFLQDIVNKQGGFGR